MSAQALLERLSSIRKAGPDSWTACCPAHEDRHPSLSIRLLEDGRTLVHCFAGCSTDAVMGSVGLSVSSLFPPRPTHPRNRVPAAGFSAWAVLRSLPTELLIVLAAAGQLAEGEALSPNDLNRLMLAEQRVRGALGVANA